MRLSTLPTAFGEKMVMRIFDPDTTVKTLEASASAATTRSAGKSWSRGRTASSWSPARPARARRRRCTRRCKRLATDEVNVCTIEDPIEMIQPAFNQTQVQPQLDLGFAEGLRALMRQDPDIIMVGEIRDLQTAEMAIQAALTGHLVFCTLHTNDAASAHHPPDRPGRARRT